ncbi:hypothetical protein K493DRAFT_338529 [Basidiobolus meristosporus CBS 931.73]|uniref:Uncharacterized protein n=1 Tax=Basidiobolus meristosporus CBS 931.73 TaxID=1314790 RepID=A0A1Y1Y4U5_9FUNG|nr:hypothetical protein K493DRAFT_338529 [Basidiobolus meristosporus CBS 931.73]|eukprot:ORX93008.1 hypothetical protein K493DRAFT_338529 [Basidiobolus meristosporus CBS 931.73]
MCEINRKSELGSAILVLENELTNCVISDVCNPLSCGVNEFTQPIPDEIPLIEKLSSDSEDECEIHENQTNDRNGIVCGYKCGQRHFKPYGFPHFRSFPGEDHCDPRHGSGFWRMMYGSFNPRFQSERFWSHRPVGKLSRGPTPDQEKPKCSKCKGKSEEPPSGGPGRDWGFGPDAGFPPRFGDGPWNFGFHKGFPTRRGGRQWGPLDGFPPRCGSEPWGFGPHYGFPPRRGRGHWSFGSERGHSSRHGRRHYGSVPEERFHGRRGGRHWHFEPEEGFPLRNGGGLYELEPEECFLPTHESYRRSDSNGQSSRYQDDKGTNNERDAEGRSNEPQSKNKGRSSKAEYLLSEPGDSKDNEDEIMLDKPTEMISPTEENL